MNIRPLVQSAWMTGVAFFAVAVLASSAMAATVVANCTGIGPSNTELNASVGCPKFNGTGLVSVEIAFTGDLNGSIGLTNLGALSQSVQGTTQSKFTVGSLAGFTIPIPLFTVTYTTGLVSLAGGATQNFPGLFGTGGASTTNSNAGTFATYLGSGVFNIPVTTLTSLLVEGGGGQIGSTQSTQASANAIVTYTYQPSDNGEVPEPQTYLLLGGGLSMLAFLRRRRNAA